MGPQRSRRLTDASSFVVLVLDPVTGELDSHGPFAYPEALAQAGRRREEFDQEDLGEVVVLVVPLHPAPPCAGA